MIDGFRRVPRRTDNLHPSVKQLTDQIVVGDHSKGASKPAEPQQPEEFKPPLEIAANEEQKGSNGTASNLLPNQPPTPPQKKRSIIETVKGWWGDLPKKKKIFFSSMAGIVLAAGLTSGYILFFTGSPPVEVPVVQQAPKEVVPATVASNLTGVQVDPALNERPVTAVMIENSMEARPQSGLLQAGVVFEAIAEGGITRFVSLYQDTEPDYVGPVRSARPYYMQWLLGFDAAYAHAGGSAQALSLIPQWNVKDLPHHNSYFWRVNNRAAPHNLYTSIPELRKYAKSKGFNKAEFTPLPRKEKEEPSAAPTASTIALNISSANYNVRYNYDAETNSYKRVMGGAPHTDEKSGKQIAPKVVVALVMPQGRNGIYYTYQTIGTGQVFIFQDGKAFTGTWKKDSNNANFTFTDENGETIQLNPGQTWFTALGDSGRVTYAP